jgi:hypothetical protein
MVHALYLALRLFISGYFAHPCSTPAIPKRRHRGLPANGTAFGPRGTRREHSGGGSPAQTAHTGDTREPDHLRTAKHTAAVAVPLKQRTPAIPRSRSTKEG